MKIIIKAHIFLYSLIICCAIQAMDPLDTQGGIPLDELHYMQCYARGDYENKKNTQSPPLNEPKPCVFCKFIEDSKEDDAKNLIVKRFATCTAFMNLYPYATGHMLLVPNRHTGKITDLSDEETIDLARARKKMCQALEQLYTPDGLNAGINQGKPAGASKHHLHEHIIPRNTGDASMLLTIHKTILVTQEPAEVCKQIRTFLKEQHDPALGSA